MDRALDCPHCASDDLEVVAVTSDGAATLAVHCTPSHGDDPKHAIHSWNLRFGSLSVVK
jgi:hypothetical protein